MKYPWLIAITCTTAVTCGYVLSITRSQQISAAQSSSQWPPRLDAIAAAPNSHRVLLENERVRVLDVVVKPGEREPVHTHRWPSLMLITHPAKLRYFPAIVLGNDVQLAEGQVNAAGPKPTGTSIPQWLEPEGPHAVENIDSTEYRAIRVEIKPGR